MSQEIQFTSEHLEMLTEHEVRLNSMDKKTDVISEISTTLTRLVTLQEENAKANVERDKDGKRQAEALIILSETSKRTTETLDKLNSKIDKHEEKLESLANKYNKRETFSNQKLEISKSKLALYGTIIVAVTGAIATIVTALAK